MSTPLNFGQSSSGGAYGTHSSSKNTRQRRNPADYGPFSSPHASFDDPVPFPPYAELPFTSLKRRRQLQKHRSLGNKVMTAVFLSPVVVFVLWTVGVTMFATNHRSVAGKQKGRGNNNSNRRQQSNKINPMNANYYGSAGAQTQGMYMPPGNVIYNVGGTPMMMTPLQPQVMNNGYQQQQQIPQMQPPQGQAIPIAPPLGNVMNSGNAAPVAVNNLQQPVMQQAVPIPANNLQQPVMQQAADGSLVNGKFQQTVATANGAGRLQPINAAQQQMPQVTLDSVGNASQQQPVMTNTGVAQQKVPAQALNPSNTNNSNAVQVPAVTKPLQMSDSSGAAQNQIQDAPAKQAVYYYDPKDTKMSKTGDIIKMPTIVYDADGKPMTLAQLQQKAPIYVQPPMQGASSTGTSNSEGVNGDIATPSLVGSSARGASLVDPSKLEAAIPMPQAWGASQSQDQTIIISTVAVMALLVGALSARRLRGKSFLAACIENESLEDDLAYDDAYTTTAGASGAIGVDSSYSTFGGWKGDLEKFDV